MRDGKELKPCLSGRGVTKVFGFGDAKTVAVDHVDFDFHEGEKGQFFRSKGRVCGYRRRIRIRKNNPFEDVARADQRNGR